MNPGVLDVNQKVSLPQLRPHGLPTLATLEGLSRRRYLPDPLQPKQFSETLESLLRVVAGDRSKMPQLRDHLLTLPPLRALLLPDSRGSGAISLLDHQLGVLGQHCRYVMGSWLPKVPEWSAMSQMKFLAIAHDLGKDLPVDKNDAGHWSAQMTDALREWIGYSDAELKVAKALLSIDPIGRVFHWTVCHYSHEVERAFDQVRHPDSGDIPPEVRNRLDPRIALRERYKSGAATRSDFAVFAQTRITDDPGKLAKIDIQAAALYKASKQAGIAIEPFMRIVTAFFCADASGWGVEGGNSVNLEFLFALNPNMSDPYDRAGENMLVCHEREPRLQFSPGAEKAYELLCTRVRALAAQESF